MDKPQNGYQRLAIVVLGVLLTLLAMTADAMTRHNELNQSWRDYVAKRTTISPAYQFPHATCFRAAALHYQLPESLLIAVARGESDFNATARSRANAHGVMQIQWPGTAKHLGIHRLSELYDPCTNIDAGARYLKELLQKYDDNLHLALAAYNYGPSRISASSRSIPDGAVWYSGYVLRHLNYVLGDNQAKRQASTMRYSDIGQSTLLSFGEPYRAEAFIQRIEQHSPDVVLDWFRRGTGEFEVVLTYTDRDEFDQSVAQLARSGFRLD